MKLIQFLNTLFKDDGFLLIDANKKSYTIGNPKKENPITLKILDESLHRKLLLLPDLYFGEAYTNGSVVIENGKFINARVSLASVAPKPLFVKEVGDVLVGKSVSPESIQEAAVLAKNAATPISDMRGTAEYRKHLCEVLTQRALDAAIERAQEN